MKRKSPFNRIEKLLLCIPTWIFVGVFVLFIMFATIVLHEDSQAHSICNQSKFLSQYTKVFCSGSSVLLQSAESIAIIAGLIVYFKEVPDRKARKHYEAWQVIDNAAAAKVPTSYARKQALEDLCSSNSKFGFRKALQPFQQASY
jgi:hypothetical protein